MKEISDLTGGILGREPDQKSKSMVCNNRQVQSKHTTNMVQKYDTIRSSQQQIQDYSASLTYDTYK